MAEDGWDRLAASFSGFHGGVMLMAREFDWPGTHWGDGNWEPYPIADFLFHDKVLMYQHDLYEDTMTDDPAVLTFNLAFGLVQSYSWEGDSLSSSWLGLAGSIQRTLGPLYAGRRLLDYRDVADNVTKSVFEGGLTVTANWSGSAGDRRGPHDRAARVRRAVGGRVGPGGGAREHLERRYLPRRVTLG